MTASETTPRAQPRSVARPWAERSLPITERVELLLSAMTLTEKVAQLGSHWDDLRGGDEIIAPMQDVLSSGRRPFEKTASNGIGHLTRVLGTRPASAALGAERLARAQRYLVSRTLLGIPAIAHEECLTGFTTMGATVYPTALAWAATFDPDLVEEMAQAIGSDMRDVGVHQGLAPVLDVVRDYRWGRVEETLGEDPYLVAVLGTAYVRGLQSAGVVATLKHFAGYSASTGGRNHAPVLAGPRELADVILPPFEMAVRAGGARSVMNSYAEVDGMPAVVDHQLLTALLRHEWGFTGTTVSDYWSIAFLKSKHRVAATMVEAGALALAAGMDVELPDTSAYGLLPDAVAAGLTSEAQIDHSVRRVLQQKAELGLLDDDWSPEPPARARVIDLNSTENQAIAYRLAAESVVLLENSEGLLPLAPRPGRIAVIGPCADDARAFLGCYSYPVHVLPRFPQHGLGLEVPTLPDALRRRYPHSEVQAAPGCPLDEPDTTGIRAAVELAADSDLVIAVVGDRSGMFGKGTSGEGSDAADLQLPGVQAQLLEALAGTGTPTVVVVLSGRPYALGRFVGRFGAMIQSFFPGQAGAAAIADVLSGAVNPSGRLPVQIPASDGGMPHTYLAPPLGHGGDRITNLSVAPAFPFGHGLSYTNFEHVDLELDTDTIGPDGELKVSSVVRNTGALPGSTVVQLYFTDPVAQVTRPVRQLLGFARLTLDPGQAARVCFRIHADRFSFTGRDLRRIVEPGTIELMVGGSSADLPLRRSIEITGQTRIVGPGRVLTTGVEVCPGPGVRT